MAILLARPPRRWRSTKYVAALNSWGRSSAGVGGWSMKFGGFSFRLQDESCKTGKCMGPSLALPGEAQTRSLRMTSYFYCRFECDVTCVERRAPPAERGACTPAPGGGDTPPRRNCRPRPQPYRPHAWLL